MQDLSLRVGLIEFPDKGISGRIRVPIRVFVETWWNKEREGEDMAMMRSEGRRGLSKLENRRKGDGRGGDGGVKLLRSSLKNLEGGGISVRISSMFLLDLSPALSSIQERDVISIIIN